MYVHFMVLCVRVSKTYLFQFTSVYMYSNMHVICMYVCVRVVICTYVFLVCMYMLLVFTHSWLVHTPG